MVKFSKTANHELSTHHLPAYSHSNTQTQTVRHSFLTCHHQNPQKIKIQKFKLRISLKQWWKQEKETLHSVRCKKENTLQKWRGEGGEGEGYGGGGDLGEQAQLWNGRGNDATNNGHSQPATESPRAPETAKAPQRRHTVDEWFPSLEALFIHIPIQYSSI